MSGPALRIRGNFVDSSHTEQFVCGHSTQLTPFLGSSVVFPLNYQGNCSHCCGAGVVSPFRYFGAGRGTCFVRMETTYSSPFAMPIHMPTTCVCMCTSQRVWVSWHWVRGAPSLCFFSAVDFTASGAKHGASA